LGLRPGDVIVWPLAAALVGLALIGLRTAPTPGESSQLPDWAALRHLPPEVGSALGVLVGTRRGAWARLGAGVLSLLAGVVAFIVTFDSWSALRSGFVAMVAVFVGLALVLGPGVSKLLRALVAERQERIRADERAEVAAHLHDSVLQTLALVQRRARDPRE